MNRRQRFNIETTLSDVISDRVDDGVREVPVRRKVFAGFIMLAAALMGVMIARVLYIGVFRHNFYSARAERNVTAAAVLPAPRGIITDRFGKPLVRNDSSFNAVLHPQYLPRDAELRTAAMGDIAAIIGTEAETLAADIARRDWNTTDRMVLKENLSQDELVAFAASDIPGIAVEPGFRRVSAEPLVFSHLVGYTGLASTDDLDNNPSLAVDDVVGRSGLEAFYDAALRGTNGEEATYRDAQGNVLDVRTTRPAAAGAELPTYIDAEFQKYIYNRLADALSSLGRTTGLAIALNPQNGEVLAYIGVPGFDPLRLSDYLSDPTEPLFNRGVSGRYNPGSTIKPLVATAALAEGVISPQKEIYSKGYIEVPNPYQPGESTRFPDWRPQGWVNVMSALARSSNVYFYEVGGGFEDQPGLGITRLKKWWQKFGFDQPTGIDLAGETVGLLPDPEWKEDRIGEPWRLGDTYHVSIGQGDLSITPIRLISYIATVANGGTIYEPRIASSIGGVSSTPVIENDLSGEIGDELAYVQAGMRDGVTKSYGTSYLLHDLPVTSSAKTGSAQIENNTKTNAFFVGYMPAENPVLALLILIEDSREGSSNTVPVARDVFLWYYEHRLKS